MHINVVAVNCVLSVKDEIIKPHQTSPKYSNFIPGTPFEVPMYCLPLRKNPITALLFSFLTLTQYYKLSVSLLFVGTKQL